MQPFSFLAQLSLNPTLQSRAIRPTAQQQRLLDGQFRGRGELSGPTFRHAIPALPLPTQRSRLPEHLALQCRWQVLLLHPVLGVGVGVAIAHTIAEGFSVAVGIPKMAGYVLPAGGSDSFEGIEKPQNAVAFVCASQINGGLGQGIQPLR